MAKAKKKSDRRPAPKGPVYPTPVLAPQVLEQAAQGWLQSSGASAPVSRPVHTGSDQKLTGALTETLRELREEIADLRSRIERLESR